MPVHRQSVNSSWPEFLPTARPVRESDSRLIQGPTFCAQSMISLEIKGMFIPPDQQTSSFSNKKMGACQDVKEGPCERDFVTPDGR
jgi:hypothetical protein